MTRSEAIRRLRMLAKERAFGCKMGRQVGSDRLIQAGLDALLADIDSPSLPLLAGLGRSEEPEAPELFDRVLDELGLAFRLPVDPDDARWALARWWAALIADGDIDPATGADMIWVEAAMELDYPETLQPIVEWAIILTDWNEDWDITLDEIRRNILTAAHDLLTRLPQPPAGT
ncbi:hypothetical protein [Streptomyces sp. H39-S7]|uniref:hypothetical protein n=1 Tax=Streptomyces sp. H39-S7 TaxID=3004357 RepID=UPI0022AEECC8|nr:hypothetical protein [Streptomyces sp. H39-S7]MCZ4124645.1 hypothetical protein [Streptomyces sp. H39-S7]